MSVDWTKPIQTRDGKMKGDYYGAVDIYHVVRLVGNGNEMVVVRLIDGLDPTAFGETPLDIVNVPQPVTVEIGERWANVYFSDVGGLHLNVFHGKIAAAENARQAHPHYICSFKLPSTIEGEVLSL